MKAEKDKKTGKWLIQYRYTDWQGKRRKSTKRGFATKREAEEWLRNFLITQKADFDMKFEDFWKIYCADMETRLREHTMRTKKYIVELKILPYFGNKRVNDITAADIRQWQNELIKMGYSPTYLKTINNQLSAIFNYAVRYYDLKSNPCAKAGSMGKSKAEEMDFWTGEEFRKFIDSVMNKRLSSLFNVSLDQLIKGDIEKMKEIISEQEIKKFNYYGSIYTVHLAVLIISAVPLFMWLGRYAYIPFGILFIITQYWALKVEKLKKKNDIQTYKEIVAFTEGKKLDELHKAVEVGKRPYQNILKVIISAGVTAMICFLIGVLMHLFLN